MALSSVTVTVNLTQLLGEAFDARRTRAYVKTNVANGTLMDTSTGEIRLGDQKVTIGDDGTGSFTTWAPGADGNPVSWQTSLVVEYPRTGQRDRQVRTFGPYTITASVDLADLEEEQAVPAEYLTTVTTLLDGYVTDAETARDETQALRDGIVGDLGTTDSQTATLINTPSSLTASSLMASIRQTRRLYHLDSYNDFFGGGKWVTGQSTTATTTTSAVSAGASVIPVADATGLSSGVQLVVAEGTANQKVYTVASVASLNVTIVGTVTHAISSGAAVTPLWTNSSHLTTAGYRAFAYFIANAKDDTNQYVIGGTAPKVTYLGNSWISQGGSVYGDELDDRIPGATAVNAGVAGNTSTQLLARFDTDVPADSDYVVFNEPGVNDDTGTLTPAVQATNLQELVRKIRAIGAVPIYTGHVPLADKPTYSAARQTQVDAVIGDGTAYPGAGHAGLAVGTPHIPETDSLGIGTGALLTVTTGSQDTVVGVRAGDAITTGFQNTLMGREAGTAVTTGNDNTAMGNNALRANSTGSRNTMLGSSAGASATGSDATILGYNAGVLTTTATGNVFVGSGAGYTGNGSAANATTTAINQVVIGMEAGQGSATQVNGITAVGRRANASGTSATALGTTAAAGAAYALALGAGASAAGAGSFAIGTDSGAAGASSPNANEGVLGTANHTVKVPGRFETAASTTTKAGLKVPHGTAPTSPVDGDMWTTTAGLYVRINGATVGPLS